MRLAAAAILFLAFPASAQPTLVMRAPIPRAAAAAPAGPKPLVPFPHPLITEVLYAVPTGAAGDASGDGVRDPSGDEFVELVNPHDRPISLRSYTLSAKVPEALAPGKKARVLKFTFPACELQPGEVAVVFNGHGCSWSGPVGDTARAPAGPHPRFDGARVFGMNQDSARGFTNKADYLLLTAPDGAKVHCIVWGDIKPPRGVALVEQAPWVSGQSITRRTVDGPLEPHPPIDGYRFSPGRFPFDAAPPKPAEPAPPKAPDPAARSDRK